MYRVLIADDEPKVSQLIKNLIRWDQLDLQLMGIAKDGNDALAMIELYQPEIVITDIRMPGCDGMELIRRGKELNPKIDFVIISGYQHFDYAHNAIKYNVKDYLLKPLKKEEINETLQHMVDKYDKERMASSEKKRLIQRVDADSKRIREAFVDQLFHCPDKLDLSLPIERLNEAYHLNLNDSGFITIEIKADIVIRKDLSKLQKVLVQKLTSITQNTLENVCDEFFLNPTERTVQAVLNIGIDQKRELRKWLYRIIDESQGLTELFQGIKTTIGVSDYHKDLTVVDKVIHKVHRRVLDRLILGTGRMIEKEVEPVSDDINTFLTYSFRQAIAQSTENLDCAALRKNLTAFKEHLEATDGITGYFVRELMEEILNIVLFTLRQHLCTSHLEPLVYKRFREGLGMCCKISQAIEWLDVTLSVTIEDILKTKENEYLKPIQEAQKYIQEHFEQSIKLEDVSKLTGFNATYFSTLFKKETGISFLTYLTEVRMKEAKKKLSDLSKTIADISCEVGYQDLKHFTKQFKKATGLTPSKYRKLYY